MPQEASAMKYFLKYVVLPVLALAAFAIIVTLIIVYLIHR
jgi:hypothetical protein